MRATVNDDNGSLYTGRERLRIGSLVQIAGEARARRVTYTMGSEVRGWRACFKGQGAVPVGEVQWLPLDALPEGEGLGQALPERPAVVPPTVAKALVTVAPNPMPAEASAVEQVVVSGFDSAWTASSRGALASIVVEDGRASLQPPELVTFAEAPALLEKHRRGAAVQLVAIDQPLIVPNAGGRRPVESAVSSLIGRLGGAVQPANRGRSEMFGNDAPLWAFLKEFRPNLDPHSFRGATQGRFALEVYPALALIGLLPTVLKRNRLPKYNPDRATFLLQDWALVCEGVSALAMALGIEEAQGVIAQLRGLNRPRKHDQDRLDAIICALVGYFAWSRPSEVLLVGDAHSGYIVSPGAHALLPLLRSAALRVGIAIKVLDGADLRS